jgi:hypothetical protein
MLVSELKNRFGVIENKKTYRVPFNRRNQKTGETVENNNKIKTLVTSGLYRQ